MRLGRVTRDGVILNWEETKWLSQFLSKLRIQRINLNSTGPDDYSRKAARENLGHHVSEFADVKRLRSDTQEPWVRPSQQFGVYEATLIFSEMKYEPAPPWADRGGIPLWSIGVDVGETSPEPSPLNIDNDLFDWSRFER